MLGKATGRWLVLKLLLRNIVLWRVNVLNANRKTFGIIVERGRPVTAAQAAQGMANSTGEPQRLGLHSAPKCPIRVTHLSDRPRLDRLAGRGRAVTVGRIPRDEALDNGRFVVTRHNRFRGAAGNTLLNAELLRARGMI